MPKVTGYQLESRGLLASTFPVLFLTFLERLVYTRAVVMVYFPVMHTWLVVMGGEGTDAMEDSLKKGRSSC